MRALYAFSLTVISFSLSGCVVGAVADVVTAPVRIGSKAVDLASTSQAEADEARGREIRRREERLGKLEREYREQSEECADGNRSACQNASETYQEMQELTPSVPVEPSN